MDFACPDPGTTFTFDSGLKVVARGHEGKRLPDGYRWRRAVHASRPCCSPIPRPTAATRRPSSPRSGPSACGRSKSARGSRRATAPAAKLDYILTVARYEKRTGPGDALIDTFLIEMNEAGHKGYRSISRWWISPEVKYLIRFDSSDSNGTSGNWAR